MKLSTLNIIAVLIMGGLIWWSMQDTDAAPPMDELQIAGAYHCGMLDALQEKHRRGKACDMYKEIAKRRGVNVPP